MIDTRKLMEVKNKMRLEELEKEIAVLRKMNEEMSTQFNMLLKTMNYQDNEQQ